MAAALDAAFDGVALITMDLRVQYANPALCAMGGYERPQDMVGRPIADLLTQDTVLRVGRYVEALLSGGQATLEGTGRVKDGRLVPIEVGTSVLRHEDGQPYAFLAVVRDISERKRAEQALRESEIKYRLLFENLNDAALLADAQTGFILEANKQAEMLLGRTRDEIVGMHQTELHPPGQDETYRRKFERHVQVAAIAGYDGEVAKKDGTVVPVTISAAPMEIAGRRLIVGLFHDISKRKRAEEALRQSEERYRALFENMGVGVTLVREDRTVVAANPASARMFHTSADKMVGKLCYREFEKRNAVCAHCPATKALETGTPHEVITKGVRDDGTQFTARVCAFPVPDADGKCRSFIEVVEDVTEGQRMEQALAAKHREMESFVYTVSHDLRAPLVSLEGFAKLLADEYSERLDAQGHDYLRRLRANVSTMNSLLGDLLELSRVGRAEEPKQAVPVADVVAEALDTLAGMISKSEAHVTVARDLPTVQYSRVRLFQVFANLIANAIKFAREGVPPQVEIQWESLNSGCRFLVTDNGIGIADGQKHKLFEIFSRLNNKDVEGTGIGLAIVKRIVENHGGQVGVESTPGEGSTFWFTVPGQHEPFSRSENDALQG